MERKIKCSSKQVVVVVLVLAAILTVATNSFAGNGSDPTQVNINTADSEQLAVLPGIGQSKADAIVKYRSENGPFPTVDSIVNVRGIGMKVLEKVRPFITTNNQ
jgi:competence protein ComEA